MFCNLHIQISFIQGREEYLLVLKEVIDSQQEAIMAVHALLDT